MPSGAGCSTTHRDKDALLNKRSVLRIENNDDNCFWYALACLMNPNNRAIRDSRNTKIRENSARIYVPDVTWSGGLLFA